MFMVCFEGFFGKEKNVCTKKSVGEKDCRLFSLSLLFGFLFLQREYRFRKKSNKVTIFENKTLFSFLTSSRQNFNLKEQFNAIFCTNTKAEHNMAREEKTE